MLKELPRAKIESVSVDSSQASEILIKHVNDFLQRKGDRLGILLIEYDKSEDGMLFAPGAKIEARTMEREELKRIMMDIMTYFGASERRTKARRRTDVDPKTYKPTPSSYTEYILHFTPNTDLVFKTVQEIENGVVKKGWVSIDGIHRKSFVTSPLLPKGKR